VKKPISKANVRTEIECQVEAFLNQGGAIDEIERGTSGRLATEGPFKPQQTSFQQPRAERTYVAEVIAAMDQRRKAQTEVKKPKKRKPKKKMIYDDFGEPLRWEWVDE
jgi:hypothetical protein